MVERRKKSSALNKLPSALCNPPMKWALVKFEQKNGHREPTPVDDLTSWVAADFCLGHREYGKNADGLALDVRPAKEIFVIRLHEARTKEGATKPWAASLLGRLDTYGEWDGRDAILISRCRRDNPVTRKYLLRHPEAAEPEEVIELVGRGLIPLRGKPIDESHTELGNVVFKLHQLVKKGQLILEHPKPKTRAKSGITNQGRGRVKTRAKKTIQQPLQSRKNARKN